MAFRDTQPKVVLVLVLGAVGLAAPAQNALPQRNLKPTVELDMTTWHRRDYSSCNDRGRVTVGGGAITIEAERSALKYWQLPTLIGPFPVNERAGWMRRCDRPPTSFGAATYAEASRLGIVIRVHDYPYLTWRWRVPATLDDSETADRNGKIQRAGDDFAAKLGVQMRPQGDDELREIAYVWTRSIPRGTVLVQEAGALFWHFRFYRIVEESGDAHVGEWRSVTRNLLEDFKRIWPDEEPDAVLRIFVMTDGDNTGVTAEGSYADLTFHRSRPELRDSDR